MDSTCLFSRSLYCLRPVLRPRSRIQSPLRSPRVFPASATRTMSTLQDKIAILQNYSACDVSDALLKLQKPSADGSPPRAGYLADLTPFAPAIGRNTSTPKTIAPVSTVKFIPKSSSPSEYLPPNTPLTEDNTFPKDTHWVDNAVPGTIVLIDQPPNQHCAVLGGIMASRMKYLGVTGVIVNGRVRDLSELHSSALPIWARATSTVGTGAEAKAGLRNVGIDVGGVLVEPEDIVFADPLEGVVVIPGSLLDEVLRIMPGLVEMDERVKGGVEGGMSVREAFGKFRS
ncbi:ribonuclease E inhibitor RraA/Dimethylmenaquinone methyltransferase [Aspergillus filifer]